MFLIRFRIRFFCPLGSFLKENNSLYLFWHWFLSTKPSIIQYQICCLSYFIHYLQKYYSTEDNDDDRKCAMGTVFNNLFTEHMFESMGQGTTLANALKEFTIHVDKEVIHEETLVIGKAAGSLLAFAFDIWFVNSKLQPISQ